MKCPNCGHWNRASFPRCFRCGTPLPQDNQGENPAIPQGEPSSKVYIQINEEGRATSPIDERDKLAREMKDLVARKHRGEEEQQRLRRSGAQQGFAPTGRTVQTLTGRTPFPLPQNTSYSSDEEIPVEGDVRPDAIPVISQRGIENDAYGEIPVSTPRAYRRDNSITMRQMKMHRRFGARRFTRFLAFALVIACVLLAGYQFLYKPLVLERRQPTLQEQAIITPTILNDLPAHRILLPGEEGQVIWIKELKKTYQVIGGYATIEVADYTWYENSQSVTQETVTATLTPYLKTAAGEQKPLEQVTYEVEIPLSPLYLVSPSTNYVEVSTALYNIQFEVAKNSTVYINGEDYSDLVNTQDGLISYNASVSPIGENRITITTRSQYYRENTMTIILYRQPQQIRLDLAADIASRWSPNLVDDETKEKDAKGKYPQIEESMTVRGTTVTWADIKVLSPHKNLDTTQLALNGTFSFQVVFDKIGTNTIIIEASAPGYETSVVKHDVYYVPIATIYTRKAWDMDVNYTDYLNNAQTRIGKGQIYLCTGTVTEIMSNNPQLAVIKLDSNYDRSVLVENLSNDTWEVGKRYRVYADAYGLYNGMPRLIGRYTYPPLN
ncbi:MAG: zinc ribbon domain-containing protein [Clostridia bacterium]|nr:zinc ribbon domain-containing protein [Clostridia bacterium]MBQ6803904.1 zinc ribbon domain-containing protein [Clostridia bacterium]